MDLGLENKVALVGGSSAGLGRAIAGELAGEGARVILCARHAERLAAARQAIEEASGSRVVAVVADLSTAEGIERVVRESAHHFEGVDILVTNVGGPPPGKFEELTSQMWRDAFHLTLESAVNLVREILPGMKKRGWGRILNVTSIAVKQPVENLMLSNSLRAAVTGFARTLANEVAPFGITVNNILPGYTRTERLKELAAKIAIQKSVSEKDAYLGWEQEIPMGRLGEPREFAALAAFLASERASYITGTSITVDGGWVRSLL